MPQELNREVHRIKLQVAPMRQTILKSDEAQLMGGSFSTWANATQAIEAFQNICFSEENIQVIQLHVIQGKDPYINYLVGRGFTRPQARFYDKALMLGRILVAVYQVTDPVPVIDIITKYEGQYRLRPKVPFRSSILSC